MVKKMKIIIINSTPLNGGDAAILQGMINLISDIFSNHIVAYTIYASQSDIAKKYFPNLEFSEKLSNSLLCCNKLKYFRRFIYEIEKKRMIFGIKLLKNKNILSNIFLKKQEVQIISDYESASLIISSGGTYLTENYNIRTRLLDYEIILRTSTPLIFFPQSLGFFKNLHNRKSLKNIFGKSLIILVRGLISKNNILAIGVEKEKLLISPDSAFYLADKTKYSRLQKIDNLKIKKVAISVREWPYFKTSPNNIGMERYFKAIISMICFMINKYNSDITFISTCQGIPEYQFDDSSIARKIHKRLPENLKNKVIINKSFHQPEELIDILGSFDIIIATRMHVAILGFCAGTPVFPIAYEFKTQELFKELGIEKWVQDIENLDNDKIINCLDNFIQELPNIKPLLFEKIDKAKQSVIDAGLSIREKYLKYDL